MKGLFSPMDTIVPAPTSAPTTPMTPAELRAFLNENAQEQDAAREQARRARYLSAAIRRSETLFDDGYTVAPFTKDGQEFPHLFIVTKPAPVGELEFSDALPVCYAVTVSPDYHGCTCLAFKEWGECKHHLCVAREVEQDARLDAQAEEWDARAEWRTDYPAYHCYRAA